MYQNFPYPDVQAMYGYQGGGLPSGPPIPPPPPPPPDDDDSSQESTTPLPSIKVVKNDYNQHFVDTGERPQNFIRDHEPHLRFVEYPKLERLIQLKNKLTSSRAHPPVHIAADLKSFDLKSLGIAFDVILIDPPWREYTERAAAMAGGAGAHEDLTPWSLQEILQHIRVDQIAETPSFCFLWCGSQHLDDGRQCLQSWGFRRCEDICWVKTNKTAILHMSGNVKGSASAFCDDHTLFQRTKEHCLVGIRGVVRRSSDSHFIHSNIDTDVIVEEEASDAQGRPTASTFKPAELYDIIERFCLGRKRLELFGLDRNIRPGWLTIGRDIAVTNFDRDRYINWMTPEPSDGGTQAAGSAVPDGVFRGRYIGTTPEIEQIRPRSPTRTSRAPSAAPSTVA